MWTSLPSIHHFANKFILCAVQPTLSTASLIFVKLCDLLPSGGNDIFVLSDVGYDMFNKLIILSFC